MRSPALGVSRVSPLSSPRADVHRDERDDSGAGSLRQAILDANSSAGPHTIQFAIPGAGVHTITPLTPLPRSRRRRRSTATRRPGSSPNTLPFPQGTNAVLDDRAQRPGAAARPQRPRPHDPGRRQRGPRPRRSTASTSPGSRFEPGAGDGIQIRGNFIGTAPDGLSVPRGVGVTRQIRGIFVFGGVGHVRSAARRPPTGTSSPATTSRR